MITKVKLPKISANIEEATVTAWFKREGDPVRKGEPLLELTTDKAAVEFEAPRGGTLRKILAREKSVVPVGYILALLGTADDVLPDVTQSNAAILEKHRKASAPTHKTVKSRVRKIGGNVRATPAARRLAKEHDIDLETVKAALKVTVVTEESVEAFRTSR
jgi:pyruvate dehydrogenase E2 component (dihydrolipoamide acetyltransferase)